MIRINLGRDELAKPSSKNKLEIPSFLKITQFELDSKVIILLVIAVAFAGLPHLFISEYKKFVMGQHAAQMKELQEKQDVARQDVARFTVYETEMKSYEQQKTLVSERLGIVRQLLSVRNTPVNVLDALGQSLSVKTWVTSISVALAGEPNISLAGAAYSNEEISDFIDKLAESIHLADVSLDSVTSASGAAGNARSNRGFLITAVPKGVFAVIKSQMRDAASAGMPATPLGSIRTAPPSSMLENATENFRRNP